VLEEQEIVRYGRAVPVVPRGRGELTVHAVTESPPVGPAEEAAPPEVHVAPPEHDVEPGGQTRRYILDQQELGVEPHRVATHELVGVDPEHPRAFGQGRRGVPHFMLIE